MHPPDVGLDLWLLSLQSGVVQPAELGLFFLIGILGTAHCLGMCGPLVTLYSDRMNNQTAGDEVSTWMLTRQHSLFNFGRATIYAILGGFFGLLGGSLFTTTDLAIPFGNEVRGVAGLLTGVIVVLAGTGYALGRRSRIMSGDVPMLTSVFSRVYDLLVGRVDDWVGSRKIFGLGFVHGFLPCPLLYPAFLYAFGRGDPVGGALALGTLGLGTFPAMFLYGTVYQSTNIRRHVVANRLLGVAFALLGLHTMLMGLGMLGFDVPMLFQLPIYQPLGADSIRQVPVLVALPVAGIGSLLLLGAGAVSLYHRRSLSYMLLTLALLIFAIQIAVAQLAFLDLVPSETDRMVDYVSDAIMAVLVIAAISYATRIKHRHEDRQNDIDTTTDDEHT